MFISLYLQTSMIILLFMSIIFVLAIILKNNSIVDIAWGIGFIIVSTFGLIKNDNLLPQTILINSLVWIWGLRLSLHIYLRNKGKKEDFRYNNWRKTWKYFYLRSYFQIFVLQGFILLIVSMPIIRLNTYETYNIGLIQTIGILIFIIGIIFETLADYHLLEFKKDVKNKGKLIKTGLWKYSRHPNYFGEAILWLGYSLAVINDFNSIYIFISPLLISLLLLFVSGVPMLEKKLISNPEFEDYKLKTPVFFPNLKLMILDLFSKNRIISEQQKK